MTITLRDASIVDDKRLDRLVQFDERSRNFPIREISEKKPLRSYTWRCGEFYNQGQEGACFPAGTLIRMADGHNVPIEKLKLLDEVVTAEGRTGKVLQLMVRHSDEMLSIKLRGHNHLRLTPEHPILTRRGYVAAKDIVVGDSVALTKWIPERKTRIKTSEFINKVEYRGKTSGKVNTGGVESKVTDIPEEIELTPEFGRLLGLYAAEGWVTENKVCWAFHANEKDTLVKDTLDLLNSVFGIEGRLQYRPNNCIYVNAYGKKWRVLFQNLIGGNSKRGDKHLSEYITSGPREFLKALFEGWMDGDGHRRMTAWEGVSVCHTLAVDLYSIAQGLGMRPVIRCSPPYNNEHAKTRQNRWSVIVHDGDNQHCEEDDSAVWRKVTSVESVQFSGHVYNMHVEGDNSYVAEGVGVHNCVAFALGHEAAARPAEVRGIHFDWLVRRIYWEAQKIDPWDGGSYPGAAPRYEGTSVLAGVKSMHKRKFFKSYRWGFGINDVLTGIGYHGPAVLGVRWYEGMFNTDENGFIKPTGRLGGGHAVLARAVNVKEEYVTIRNSWGRGWGVNGDCYIRFSDLETLLHQQGEAVFMLNRTAKFYEADFQM